MDAENSILLKTFNSTHAADLAASQLRSGGIECLVTADDCGGMYPPLGVIRLLVNTSDAVAAREILQQASAGRDSSIEEQEPSAGSTRSVPPPRVYRFNSGVAVGVILGALVHFGYTRYEQYRDRTDRYYNDTDDLVDEEAVWRNGEMVEQRFDQNGDGRWDYKAYFKNGVPVSNELDDNFDGKWDVALSYSARGFLSSGQQDTDFNGIPDMTVTYENGIQKQTDWRPNGTNVVLLRQLFRHGVLDEELRDLNGDGWFDLSIKYDPFNTPIRTNNLRATTP
jgi:hypothetical protein